MAVVKFSTKFNGVVINEYSRMKKTIKSPSAGKNLFSIQDLSGKILHIVVITNTDLTCVEKK